MAGKFLLATIFLMASVAFAENAIYLWMDGTTAPIECVSLCQQNGLFSVEKIDGDLNYLSDGCRQACFGPSAGALQAGGQAANAPNTKPENSAGAITSGAAQATSQATNAENPIVAEAGGSVQENSQHPAPANSSDAKAVPDAGAANGIGMKTGATDGEKTIIQDTAPALVPDAFDSSGVPTTRSANGGIATPMSGKSMGASEIAGDEKMMEMNASASIANTSERDEKIREIRAQYEKIAIDHIAGNDKVDFDALSALIPEINITPEKLYANGNEIPGGYKTVVAKVGNGTLEISQHGQYVSLIDSGGTGAKISGATVSPNSITVDGKKLILMPSDAASKIDGEVEYMELAGNGSSLVYNARAKTSVKFLGIIGTSYEKDVQIDAQSGKILGETKPWWDFLVFGK